MAKKQKTTTDEQTPKKQVSWQKVLITLFVLALLGSCSTCLKKKDTTATAEPVATATATATPEETKKEEPTPTPEERKEPTANEIIAGAALTLDNFIKGYDMSLAEQRWTIAKFDDNGAWIGLTDITYNGTTGKFIFVGTPTMEDGKMKSITPHYVEVNGQVLGNDGYCDEFFETIQQYANN